MLKLASATTLSHDDVTLAVAKSKRKYPDIFQDI